jgi:2,4-dienoyl-CoA reductase-like NADH-dependent reductase (Old Yellow Enzyme family)
LDFNLPEDTWGQFNLELVEDIHRHRALASIELNHAVRWAPEEVLNCKSPIGPSHITPEGEAMSVLFN